MEINAKQAGTIIVALIFLGSTITFALNWAAPSETEESVQENVFERPLSSGETQNYINNDNTVLIFFYSINMENLSELQNNLDKIAKDFGSRLLIEKIDINKFQSFSSEYNIRYAPTFIIKGNQNKNEPIRIEGETTPEDLKKEICGTYKNKPNFCV